MAKANMQEDTIYAYPTKELFINILTRDVNVKDCILDLVDNSVDSYIRNELTDKRLIMINISEDYFEIFDNCGGIGYKYLQDKVFKFGVDQLSRDHATLGVYGIGLKRSIFKLGDFFELETDDGKTFSKVSLKINEWKDKEEWDFPFNRSDTTLQQGKKPYTKIIVKNLHDVIKNKFVLTQFINNVTESISVTYSLIIKNKIDIYVNKSKISPYPLDFTLDDYYKPSRMKEKIGEITIDIICGMNPRKSRGEKIERKGWNIFFNERLIVKDDTTPITGWTGEKSALPKYHPIFNEFKGIVFIQSNDPSKLPLNTGKNGFNTDTVIYQNILDLMIAQARPVVDYLTTKYQNAETNLEEIEKEVDETVDNDEEESSKSSVEAIRVGSTFSAPERIEPIDPIVNISYQKPKKLVDKVKKLLKVRSAKDVGIKTFDYFFEMEGPDDDEE